MAYKAAIKHAYCGQKKKNSYADIISVCFYDAVLLRQAPTTQTRRFSDFLCKGLRLAVSFAAF